MALIHQSATITPTKQEILSELAGAPVEVLGAYRFDDPDGEVGVEAHLFRANGRRHHVVLTYRGAALPGNGAHLITTMEHTVLGRRWIYDGTHDPVAVSCFARALSGRQGQSVEAVVRADGSVVVREPAILLELERTARVDIEPAGVRFASDLGGGVSAGADAASSRLIAARGKERAVVAWSA